MSNAIEVRSDVSKVAPEVIEFRRHLHQYPELSWKEKETQTFILTQLEALKLQDVRSVARTGATALISGDASGPCVLWRADIDALPIFEKTDFEQENARTFSQYEKQYIEIFMYLFMF